MKKIVLLVLGLLLNVSYVNALTINSEGDYITKKNVKISKTDYEKLNNYFDEKLIDNMRSEILEGILNGDAQFKEEIKYSITTDTIDSTGNIVNSKTINATEEEAKLVANNKNIMVSSQGELVDMTNQCASTYAIHQNEHQTSSKKVRLQYVDVDDGGNHLVAIDVTWYSEPLIKQYDVLAVRWNQSLPTSNITNYYAYQEAYDDEGNDIDYQEYSIDGTNTKQTKYGIGQSMNLFNNGVTYKLLMAFEVIQPIDGYIYGTYQHARHSSANTLAISQAYSFSNNGLGNVLYYSNSTYRNYYDGMEGVKASLDDNYSFIVW